MGNEIDFTHSAIGVFVDHKRCELPLSDQIWTNIRNGLRVMGYRGEVDIFVVGDVNTEPLLSSRGILHDQIVDTSIINPYIARSLHFISFMIENLSISPKDTIDKRIIIQSMSWASAHLEDYREHGVFLGITDDPKFQHAMKNKKFQVLIANDLSTTDTDHVPKLLLWKSVALHFLSLENLLNRIMVSR